MDQAVLQEVAQSSGNYSHDNSPSEYTGITNAGDIKLPYYATASRRSKTWMQIRVTMPVWQLNTITKRKIVDGYGRTGEVDGYYKVGQGSNPRLGKKIHAYVWYRMKWLFCFEFLTCRYSMMREKFTSVFNY